jgi:hypothetical protein
MGRIWGHSFKNITRIALTNMALMYPLYSNDAVRSVVSVRSGTPVSKEVKAAEDSWKLHPRLSIEDPFETAYDVGHVLRDSSFNRIRKELARAYGILSGRSTEVPDGATPKETFAVLLEPVTKEQVV